MLKNKYLGLPLALLLTAASNSVIHANPRLSEYNFGSASVLPFYTYKNTKYAILSREALGKARGMYDDFGGSRDKGENHPVITAAREFFEEAIVLLSIGLSLLEIQRYIDIAANNTEAIVAYSKNVTYITNFNAYTKALLNNFYQALKKTTDSHSKEKDRIAIVKWEVLKKVINNNKNNTNLKIEALVLHPKTKKFHKQNIPLRPYFVKKLRPFFMNKPYKQGLDKKIRFYDEQQVNNSYLSRFWSWWQS